MTSMMCTPESDSTTSDISPTLKAKAACSKEGCIIPRPKKPRSPPRLALLQSDSTCAMVAKSPLPSTICLRIARSLSNASALDRVMVASRQLDGFLDPVC